MRVACLAGDGIGPEIMAEAKRSLALLVDAELIDYPFGGSALREAGDPLPPQTLAGCLAADAVLKAPIGVPESEVGSIRPETAVIRLRKELDVFANLRPAVDPTRTPPVDLLLVRELVGGLYYGASGVRDDGSAFDTCEYHPSQIERLVRRAFELAAGRRGQLVSVDKANVLATSRLWRQVVEGVAADYPEVAVEHQLVDSTAMRLVQEPERFDVLATENLFGDILSDLAAAVTGGLGLAPSASLGGSGPGIFEPVHGSALDIAGQGVANPTAMLLSAALMLELGLGRPAEARDLREAVGEARRRCPTLDLGGRATTREFGDAVLRTLEQRRR